MSPTRADRGPLPPNSKGVLATTTYLVGTTIALHPTRTSMAEALQLPTLHVYIASQRVAHKKEQRTLHVS